MKYEYLILDIEASYFKGESPCPWLRDRFLSSIGIMTPDGTSKIWFFNPLIGDDTKHIREIQAYLDNTEMIVGHNIKFDMTWLLHIGLKVPCKLWCTMVAEFMLKGQVLDEQSLNAVSAGYGLEQKLDKMAEYWESGAQTDEIPVYVHREYLTQDLNVTHQVYKKQKDLVKRVDIRKVIDITFGVTKLLAISEYTGAPFNIDTARRFLDEADANVAKLSDKLLEVSKVTFNPASALQLGAVMYGGTYSEQVREKYTITLKSGIVKEREHWVKKEVELPGMGFKCPKNMLSRLTGKPSTSKNVIDILVPRNKQQEEFLAVLQQMSGVKKVVSTLAGKDGDKGWLNQLGVDGRLHGNFNQTITVTGRLSSSNPNMQNIPRKGTSPLKEVFRPSDPDFVIVNADLAQIEWRVAAELSRDKVMLDELNRGVDIHSLNAVQIFKATWEDKDSEDEAKRKEFKKLRQASKTVSFRLLYGGSAAGFHQDSRMPKYTMPEWEGIVDAFYKKYSGLAKWQKETCVLAAKNGFVRLPSGRVIPSPTFDMADDKSKKEWKRKLNNYPIQSFSADVINFAAVETMKRLGDNPNIKLILMVHDSMVFECHKDYAIHIVTTVMDVFSSLRELLSEYYSTEIVVPLTGECEVGIDYGNTVACTPETVQEILKQILARES